MPVGLLSLLFLIIVVVSAGGSREAEAERWANHDNQQTRSLTRELYPVRPTIEGWTTSGIFERAHPIDDETFRSVMILSNTTRRVLKAPDGITSLEGFYPNRSYTFTHTPRGGFSFYAPGPEDVDLTTAREATFAYTVLFPDGFEWVKGGKLPGFFGGTDFNNSLSCSGGRKATDCFSIRLMWRRGGMGEFYTYLPPFTVPGYEANEAQCHVPPYSECNPKYGNSIGRGAFNFASGERGTVAMRVLLNDAGVANGELELWYNEESVISLGGLIIRDSGKGRLRGLMMQTFFGGKGPPGQGRYLRPTI
ncbi:hypothetical protein BDM02DRAFT_3115530 [Thelephora ganbajun]|uniref:Uncharacterized protein n=1 Tax=Thelephora ganbajun TaxID=370292 RepID=A0ACB6ZFK4_THEGA|nr:hypothetical protein BDM02DRAFT_3115530 [Thelephora ganbajun]